MRKQLIPIKNEEALFSSNPSSNKSWLSLDEVATVEISSEEAPYPVESALLPNGGEGWRAATPGPQLLRLLFDSPQHLHLIRLHFVESQVERTQEFVLRYARNHDPSLHEIVRQQWNFSPDGSSSEVDEYAVDLSEVTTIEVAIIPDISGSNAYASLAELRLA